MTERLQADSDLGRFDVYWDGDGKTLAIELEMQPVAFVTKRHWDEFLGAAAHALEPLGCLAPAPPGDDDGTEVYLLAAVSAAAVGGALPGGTASLPGRPVFSYRRAAWVAA